MPYTSTNKMWFELTAHLANGRDLTVSSGQAQLPDDTVNICGKLQMFLEPMVEELRNVIYGDQLAAHCGCDGCVAYQKSMEPFDTPSDASQPACCGRGIPMGVSAARQYFVDHPECVKCCGFEDEDAEKPLDGAGEAP